jgi:hypothetical protein
METKFKSAFTTLELSNEDSLTSIKLTEKVMSTTKVVEISLAKGTIAKVIDALKKLSDNG